MRLLKLVLSIGLLAIASTGSASVFQCRNLFIANANLITNADIEKRIEDLAISFLQLEETNPELKQQLSSYINKELISLSQVNENSVRLFKQKVSVLKERISNSHKNKEKEDEVTRKKREAIIEIQDPDYIRKKAIFHEIRPGKFMMGEAGKKVETEITKPFAMMQTQFTQMMWATFKIALGEKDINKINPSTFYRGNDSTTVHLEGIAVHMNPYHPVEGVSHDDIIEFLAGLNKLSNSSDTKAQAWLTNLIPDHKKGDIYDLPTEAQWEFVMRDRGRANENFFDKADASELSKYAVYFNQTGTSVVASKQPRIIDGHYFYDLEGNVSEWIKDWHQYTLTGGVDPQGPANPPFHPTLRMIRGGSWNRSNVQDLSSNTRYGANPFEKNNAIGFRLVRTRD